MVTDNTSIDQRLLGGLSGAEKLKLLLKLQAGSLSDWARAQGVDVVEIHHTLAHRREYPEHCQRIADSLKLDRALVNQMIEGPSHAGSEAA